jgi:hypothetical protein
MVSVKLNAGVEVLIAFATKTPQSRCVRLTDHPLWWWWRRSRLPLTLLVVLVSRRPDSSCCRRVALGVVVVVVVVVVRVAHVLLPLESMRCASGQWPRLRFSQCSAHKTTWECYPLSPLAHCRLSQRDNKWSSFCIDHFKLENVRVVVARNQHYHATYKDNSTIEYCNNNNNNNNNNRQQNTYVAVFRMSLA